MVRRVPVQWWALGLMMVMAWPWQAQGGKEGWVPLDSPTAASPTLAVVAEDGGGLKVKVGLSGFFKGERTGKGGDFSDLRLPDPGQTTEVGKPFVPVIRRFIEIPLGAVPTVTVTNVKEEELPLSSFGLTHPLRPVQPSIPKVPGAYEKTPFAFDKEAYGSSTPYPAHIARIGDIVVVRGHRLALLEVAPLSYIASKGTLLVRHEMDIAVNFGKAPGQFALGKASPAFDRFFDRFVINSHRPALKGAQAATDVDGYLIVTPDQFVSTLQRFVDWKEMMGLKVEVLPLSQAGDLRQEIATRYQAWENPALTYVLMVGDVDIMPILQGQTERHATDLYYSTVDGTDFIPDLLIGRFSIHNEAELNVILDKVLGYQQALFSTDDWCITAGFLGTDDRYQIVEPTHDEMITSYFDPDGFLATPWTVDTRSSDQQYKTHANATTSEVMGAITAGRAIYNYSGHGGNTSWAGAMASGGVSNQDVQRLNHPGMYPFVISNACITGTLDYSSDCFAEAWHKQPNGGAIGFVGASDNSLWDEDDYWERAFYDGLFPTDSQPALREQINLADMGVYLAYNGGGKTQYYYEIYNLLGDPSMFLWMDRPRPLTVDHAGVLIVGMSTYGVHVSSEAGPVAGAMVALSDGGEYQAAGITDGAGDVVLEFVSPPTVPCDLSLVITGRNIAPTVETVRILPPEGEYLVLDHLATAPRSVLLPGRDTSIRLYMRNVGSDPAPEAAIQVTTDDPRATILVGHTVVSGVAPGAIESNDLPDIKVRMGANSADKSQVRFTLTWATDNVQGSSTFSLPVAAPVLTFAEATFEEIEGNGNGIADLGETMALSISLYNSGSLPALYTHGMAVADTPCLEFIESELYWGKIWPGATRVSEEPPVMFRVLEACPETFTATIGIKFLNREVRGDAIVTCAVGVPELVELSAQDLPQPIQDNQTIQSSVEVTAPFSVGTVEVFVDLTHTYIGDLTIALQSPTGTTVVLHSRSGGGTDNLSGWYPTDLTPAANLGVLTGQDALGTWTLMVNDGGGGDQGSLNGFTLRLTPELSR